MFESAMDCSSGFAPADLIPTEKSERRGSDRAVLELFALVYLLPVFVASVAEDVVVLFHLVFVGGAVRVVADRAYADAHRPVYIKVFGQAAVAFETASLHARVNLLLCQPHLVAFLTVFFVCSLVECVRRVVARHTALDLG